MIVFVQHNYPPPLNDPITSDDQCVAITENLDKVRKENWKKKWKNTLANGISTTSWIFCIPIFNAMK